MKKFVKSFLSIALCYAMLFSTVDFSAVGEAILNADFDGDISAYRTEVEAADDSFNNDKATSLWTINADDNTAEFNANNATIYTETQATKPKNVKWDVLSGIPSTENLYVGVGAYVYNGSVGVSLKKQTGISRTTKLNVITYGNWGANNAAQRSCSGHNWSGSWSASWAPPSNVTWNNADSAPGAIGTQTATQTCTYCGWTCTKTWASTYSDSTSLVPINPTDSSQGMKTVHSGSETFSESFTSSDGSSSHSCSGSVSYNCATGNVSWSGSSSWSVKQWGIEYSQDGVTTVEWLASSVGSAAKQGKETYTQKGSSISGSDVLTKKCSSDQTNFPATVKLTDPNGSVYDVSSSAASTMYDGYTKGLGCTVSSCPQNCYNPGAPKTHTFKLVQTIPEIYYIAITDYSINPLISIGIGNVNGNNISGGNGILTEGMIGESTDFSGAVASWIGNGGYDKYNGRIMWTRYVWSTMAKGALTTGYGTNSTIYGNMVSSVLSSDNHFRSYPNASNASTPGGNGSEDVVTVGKFNTNKYNVHGFQYNSGLTAECYGDVSYTIITPIDWAGVLAFTSPGYRDFTVQDWYQSELTKYNDSMYRASCIFARHNYFTSANFGKINGTSAVPELKTGADPTTSTIKGGVSNVRGTQLTDPDNGRPLFIGNDGKPTYENTGNKIYTVVDGEANVAVWDICSSDLINGGCGTNEDDTSGFGKSNWTFIKTDGVTWDNGQTDDYTPVFQQTGTWYNGDYGKENGDKADKLMATYAANLWMWINNGYGSYTGYMNSQNKHSNKLYNYDAWVVGDTIAAGVSVGTTTFWQNITASAATYITDQPFMGEAFTAPGQSKTYEYKALRSGVEDINNYIGKDKKFCFGSVFNQSDILYSGYCGGKESSITDRYVVAAGTNIFSVGDNSNFCSIGTCSIDGNGAISWDANGNSVRRYDDSMINGNLKVPLNEVSKNQSGEYWISVPMAIALGEEASSSGGNQRGLSSYEINFGSQHQYQEATGFRVHRGQFCNTNSGSGYNWGYDSRLGGGEMSATNWNDGANGWMPESLSQTFDIMPYRLASQYRYVKYSVLDSTYTDEEKKKGYSYKNKKDSFYNAFDESVSYNEKGNKGSVYRVDTDTCNGSGTAANIMFVAKKMVELNLMDSSGNIVATITPNGKFTLNGTQYVSNIPYTNNLADEVTGSIAGSNYTIQCKLGERDSISYVKIKKGNGEFVKNKITIGSNTYDVSATAKYYNYGYNVATGAFSEPIDITPVNKNTGISVTCTSVKEAQSNNYTATGFITNLEILETTPNGKYSGDDLYSLFIYRDTVTDEGSSGPKLINAEEAYKNDVIINTPVSEEYVKILDVNKDKAIIDKLASRGMVNTSNEDKRVNRNKSGSDKASAADQVSASFITVFVGDYGNFATGDMANIPNFNSSVGLLSDSTYGKAWNFGKADAGYQNAVNLRNKYITTGKKYPNWVLTDYIELDCTVKYFSKNLNSFVTVPAGEPLLLADVADTMCYSSADNPTVYYQKLEVDNVANVDMSPIGSADALFNGITCSSGTFYQFFICTSSGGIRQQGADTDNVSVTAIAINDVTTKNAIASKVLVSKQTNGDVAKKLHTYVSKMFENANHYPISEGVNRASGWNVYDAYTKYIRGSNATSNDGKISSHDGYTNSFPVVYELGAGCSTHQRASRAYTTAAINIVGRFGDLVLEDTSDPRYATYFKESNGYNAGSDLLDGVVPSVNRFDVSHVLTDSTGMFYSLFGADGGLYSNSMSLNASARVDGSKFSTLPLTAYKLAGVNDKFADSQLTLGYDLYFDVSSIGSFNGSNSAVYAKYYYYEMLVDSDGYCVYYPVDVYSEDSKGKTRCVYQFGKDIVSSIVPNGYSLFNSGWTTRGDDVNGTGYYDYSTTLDNTDIVGRNITSYVTNVNQSFAGSIAGISTLINSSYDASSNNKVGNVGFNVLSGNTKLLNGSQMLLSAVGGEFTANPNWSSQELNSWKNQNVWDTDSNLYAGTFSLGSYQSANNKNTDLDYLKSGQLWSLSIEIPTHFYTVPAGAINPDSEDDLKSVSNVYKQSFGHNRQAGDTTFAFDGKNNWVGSYIVVCADITAKDDMGWTYQYDGVEGNNNTFILSKSNTTPYGKPGSDGVKIRCLNNGVLQDGEIDNYISYESRRRAPMLAVWDDNYEYSQAVDLDSFGTH